jgi:hypothetical protein
VVSGVEPREKLPRPLLKTRGEMLGKFLISLFGRGWVKWAIFENWENFSPHSLFIDGKNGKPHRKLRIVEIDTPLLKIECPFGTASTGISGYGMPLFL